MSSSSCSIYKSFGSPDLKNIFCSNLNSMYCAKQHLLERLGDIMLNDYFNDLSEAMLLTTTLMQENLEKTDCLYDALKLKPDFSQLTNMITILEQSFYNVEKYAASPELRSLHLLNYVQFISCLEQSGMTALMLISKSQRHGELFEKLDQCLVPVIMESNLLAVLSNKITPVG